MGIWSTFIASWPHTSHTHTHTHTKLWIFSPEVAIFTFASRAPIVYIKKVIEFNPSWNFQRYFRKERGVYYGNIRDIYGRVASAIGAPSETDKMIYIVNAELRAQLCLSFLLPSVYLPLNCREIAKFNPFRSDANYPVLFLLPFIPCRIPLPRVFNAPRKEKWIFVPCFFFRRTRTL